MRTWNEISYDIQRVISNTPIAPGAYILKFKKNSTFIAGQALALGISKDIEPRYYSIAAGENDDEISILYTEKPDGKFTRILSLLKPGDNLMVSKPFGKFTQLSPFPVFYCSWYRNSPIYVDVAIGKSKRGCRYPWGILP